MKKIFITSLFLLTSLGVSAQIDRDKMPEPTQMPTFVLGNPVITKLPNGLTLMVVEDHKLPRVSMSLIHPLMRPRSQDFITLLQL